ncbi:MAG: leukotoxin LktA family filamentous adhesin [Rhodobiaceae bacterium]|nr:leukotoxin LktA family filamentous adhesin [Rhodobiaceae bacterium]
MPAPDRIRERAPVGAGRWDLRTLALAFAACLAGDGALAGDIAADGKTKTSVSVSGATTNITTQTVTGNHGVNTFSKFGVGSGQSVNIHVPTGAAGTVNIVNGPRSVINGAVKSVKGGQTGGSLYFANPNGVVVGPNGSFKAGTVGISTPSKAFVDGFIGPDGQPSASHVDQVVRGTAPTSDAGIDVQGSVTGSERVRLRTGGSVTISGTVTAGERAATVGAAVNTGRVDIEAGRGVTLKSGARIEGRRGSAGGAVDIRSTGTIRLEENSSVRADATGTGDAGTAVIFGGDAAVLERGAVVSASAAGTGKGGFVEFSAADLVELRGTLRASSAGGAAGTILIDPLNVTIDTDRIDNDGADLIIQATNSITVDPGVTISTRKVDDPSLPVTSKSTGASGDLTLEARHIDIGEGAQLLSFATNGFAGGDIFILAHVDDLVPADADQALLPAGGVSVTMDNATLRGRNVTIDLDASKQNLIISTAPVSTYAANVTNGTVLAGVDNLFSGKLAQLDNAVSASVNRQEVAGMPAYVSATAVAAITNSRIISGNDTVITADAHTEMVIAPTVNSVSLALGGSHTEARIVVEDSLISAGGLVTMAANTTEITDLNAYAGNVATGTGTGSNAAAAVSIRLTIAEVVVNGTPVLKPATGLPSSGDTITAGDAVTLSASADKDISVEALVAADANGNGEALAFSHDRTDVNAALGGTVTTDAAKLEIAAETHFTRAETRALVGATANPTQTPAIGSSVSDELAGWIADANAVLSAAVGEANTFIAQNTTGAFALTNQRVATGAWFGDTGFDYEDPLTEDVFTALGAASFDPGIEESATGTARLTIKATTDVEQITGHGAVWLGSGSDGGDSVIAVLARDFWTIDTEAVAGDAATVADSVKTTLNARTILPDVDDSLVRDRQQDVQDAFASPQDFELVPVAYQTPAQSDLFGDDDVTYVNDIQVASGDLAFAIDAAKRTFDLTTRAEIEDGADFAGSDEDTLTVKASAVGGIVVRRMVLADWADATGLRSVGGSLQRIEMDADTTATVGLLADGAATPTDFAEVEVSAENSLIASAATSSYGGGDVFALAGAAAYVNYDGDAEALFDARNSGDIGILTVTAAENTIATAEAGGGQVSGKSGVGFAYARVDASRDARAEYRPGDGSSPGVDDSLAPNTITVFGLDANINGVSIASAMSGAKSADEEGTSSSGGLPDFASWTGDSTVDLGDGAADGGGVSIQAATDYAYVSDETTASAVSDSVRRSRFDIAGVAADDTGMALVGAGAATSGARTVGLGAAIARLDSDREVEARVANGAWTVGSSPSALASFTVSAVDDAVLRVLGVGRAGDAPATFGTAYGSLAWLDSVGDVDAVFDYAQGNVPYVGVTAARGGGSITAGGAFDRDNDTDALPAETSGNGIGVGLTVAVSTIDEDVTADLTVPATLETDRVVVSASNTSTNWALATSTGVSDRWQITGSGILSSLSQTTLANIAGREVIPSAATDYYDISRVLLGDFALEPEFELSAENDSVNKLWSGTDVSAETASAGGAIIAATDARDTLAAISDVQIETFSDPDNSVYGYDDETPPDYEILARMGGAANVGQRSGAGSKGGLAGDVSVTTIATDWDTAVEITAASLSYAREITVEAVEEGRLTNIQHGMSEAAKGAGTIGVAVTTYDSNVGVTLAASGLSTMDPDITDAVDEIGPITVTALSDTTIKAKAVRSGNGKAGAGVAFNEMRSTGGTSVALETAVVDSYGYSSTYGSSLYGGELTISATDRTWREVVASASGTADSVGVAGAIVHDVYLRDTFATINKGGVSPDSGDATVGAYSDIRATDIAIGRANGGAKFGTALVGVLVKDDRDVVTQALESLGSEIPGDVLFTAQRSDVNLLMQATELVANSGGGAGLGVLLTGGRTAVEATVGEYGATLAGSTTFLAEDATKSFNLALGAGETSTIGGTAAVSYMQLGKPSSAAAAIGESERGGAQRTSAEQAREALGDAIEDERGADSGLFSVSDVEIAATLTIPEDTAFFLDGDVDLIARDKRRAYAVTGQLQAGIVGAAGQFLDKHFEIETVNTGGFELVIMPFGNGEADDAETTEEIDTATGDAHETSDNLEEAQDIASDATSPAKGGTALGLSMSYVRLGGTVEALLDIGPNAATDWWDRSDFSGSIGLEATSDARTAALAAGAQVSNGNNFAGAAAIARQYQYVHAGLVGGGTIEQQNPSPGGLSLSIAAQTTGKSWAIAGQVLASTGGNVGGATVAVNDFDAVTVAEVDETNFNAGEMGGALTLTAANDADVLATGVSGGGGSSNSFGLSVGYAGNRGITTAQIVGADINRGISGAPVTVSADNTLTLTSLLLQGNIGLSNGVGATIAVAKMAGETTAAITESRVGSPLQALIDGSAPLAVTATSDGKLNAAAVGIGGGASNGVAGSIAITEKSDAVRAEIADSTVNAYGPVRVEATATGTFGSVGGGDDGVLAQLLSSNTTISAGGNAGVSASLSIVKSSSTVDALISGDSAVTAGGNLDVLASNTVDLKALTLTVGGGGSFGVAVQLPLLFVEDAVTAAIDASGTGEADIETGGDVTVDASSDTTVKTFVVTAGVGGSAAAGIDVEYLRLGSETLAYVDDATIDAGGAVEIRADTDVSLTTTSIAGGAAGSVGLAGIVQVALSETTTKATINAATINAGDGLTLKSDVNTDIDQTSGQGSFGGSAGLGGTVLVLNGRDTVRAEILDAASDTSSLRSVIDAGGDVLVEADIDTTVDSQVYGLSGGTVGITATILVSRFEQDVAARIGSHASVTAGGDATVNAEQSFTQIATMGAVAGGAVGIGATIGVNSMANSVLAEIDDGAVVTADGSVAVSASGERNYTGVAVGLAGGAYAFSGAILSINYGKPSEAEESGAHMSRVSGDMESGDPYGENGDVSNGDAAVAAYLADAESGRKTLDLSKLSSETSAGKDEIRARIGAGAVVDAGSRIDLAAEETGDVSLTAGSAAGGIAGATAGILHMQRGSTVIAEVGDAASLTGTLGVTIEASAEVDNDASKNAPTAFTGAGGLVAVAGAVSHVVAGRNIDVTIGEGAAIASNGTVTIRAEEDTLTRAKALGGALGALAVGGTVAYASHESTLDIAFGTGTRPQIDANNATIEIVRDGEVTATATAAQAAAISVNGVDTTAKDDARATISLGRLDIDVGDGDVEIKVNNSADVRAVATGVSVAAISAQGSLATAKRTAQSRIISPSSIRIDAGELEIVAVDALTEAARSTVEARTTSISGGIVGSIGGALSDAHNDSLVEVDLILRELDISGDARIAAVGRTELIGKSVGVTTGTAAFGANRSKIVDDSDTLTSIRLDQDTDGDLDVDGTLTIQALSDQTVDNDNTSGQGGVVGIAAAWVTAELDSNTEVLIDSVDGSTLYAGTLSVLSDHALDLVATGDSYAARVVGAGATTLKSEVDANIDAELNGVTVVAADIAIAATASFDKNSDRFDGRIGDLGFLSGTSLSSTTTFDADMDVRIIDSDLTQTEPGTDRDGGIAFNIAADFEGDDALKIDTAGAIKAARADSEINADLTADILFDNSDVQSDGPLSATIASGANLSTEVYVNVYGLAGLPTGDSVADYDAEQTIELRNGSRLESAEADTVLAVTGGDTDIDSEIRIWNGTAIPITRQPYAASRLEMVNDIIIGADSDVLAAQDVTLTADDGNVSLYSYGISQDFYREVTEEVVNFFGGLVGADDVSLATEVGVTANTSRYAVVNDGTVVAGSRHIQRLVVNANGSIFIADDGVDYEIIPDFDPAQNLEDYIAQLEDEAEAFANDDALVARLEAEIARIQTFIDTLSGQTIDVVRVNDVFASGGNVAVTADILTGSGSFTANGDALIEIINESPAHLEIGDLVIPFRNGGEMTFRGALVTSNSGITDLNVAAVGGKTAYIGVPLGNATFSLDLSSTTDAEPTINVENRYIGTGNSLTGDLFVTGQVENLTGSAGLLTSDGNIYILGGEVNARTVDIRSGGDFFLSAALDDYLTNVDDPIGIYADFFDDIAAAVTLSSCGFGGSACPVAYTPKSGGGKILGVGSVYIYANTLNVSGEIQSGITDWDLTISAGFDDLFDLFSPVDEITTVYAPVGVDGYGSSYGTWTDPATGQPYVTGNAFLRYDRVNDRFIVDPMITKGGTVELVGTIISTGGGSISAADGYGRVNVVSEADIPVIFNRISTGYDEGVEGLIRIVDTARPGVTPGTFVTTEYRQDDDGTIERKIYNASVNTTLMRGLSDVQYDIEGDWAVESRIGSKITSTITRVEERITVAGTTGTTVISTDTVDDVVDVTGSTPVLWGERTLVQAFDAIGSPLTASATPDYEYVSPTGMGLIGAVLDGYLLDRTTTPWILLQDYPNRVERRTVTEVYLESDYALHTLPANNPIDIGFHGYTTSKVDIETKGDAVFDGGLYNRAGQTEITSTDGSIYSTSASVIFDTNRLILDAAGEIGQTGTYNDAASTHARAGIGSGSFVGSVPLINLANTVDTSLQPLQVDVADGFALTALGGDQIKIEELSGDMTIIAVDSSNREPVTLIAEGSILKHDNALPGSFVNGGAITLNARGGSIGDAASLTPIWLDSTKVRAEAAGDINLYQSGSNLNVDTIASAGGDVTVIVTGGSIRDVNSYQRIDERAEANLLEALWDELGLRGNDYADSTPNTRDTDALATYEDTRTAEYFAYWSNRLIFLKNALTGKTFVAGTRAYDPDYAVSYSAGKRTLLSAQGLSDAEIDAAEAAETAAFHEAHAIWGQGSYDPTFHYTADATEEADIVGGAFISTGKLELGLRRSLILPVSDTDIVVETPNITGVNVSLVADRNIGKSLAPLTFLNDEGLTEEARLALWTAERADIHVTPGVSFTVDQNDDLDVAVSGTLQAIAGNDVFVGSEGHVTLQTLFAGDDARIKTAGGLSSALTGTMLVNVTGRNIVLEGGDGTVGALFSPILIAQAEDGSLSARATGDVRIASVKETLAVSEVFAPVTALVALLTPDVQAVFTPYSFSQDKIEDRGGIGIYEIYSGATASITALSGDITDANDNVAADIVAKSIALTAGGSIGRIANPLEIAPTADEASVSAIANNGDVNLIVTQGNVVATAIGSVNGATRLTVDQGSLRLNGATGLPAINAGTDLTLTVAGSVTGKDGIVTDLAARGTTNLIVGGDLGSKLAPLVTRFDSGSNLVTARLSIFDRNVGDSIPVSAWLINTGDVQLGAVNLDATASTFSLVNTGEVIIDNPAAGLPGGLFYANADRFNVAALGDSVTGSPSEIRIEDDLVFGGSEMALLANGRVWVADDKALALAGTVTVKAEGFRAETAGPITVSGAGAFSVTTEKELWFGDLSAEDADVTLTTGLGGFDSIRAGDILAASAKFTSLAVTAGRIEAGTIDITAPYGLTAETLAPDTSLIVDALSIGDVDAPVTIEAVAGLATVKIDAAFLANLEVTGFPAIGFDLLRSGYDDDGALANLVANGLDLTALGVGPEGFGITIVSDGAVALEALGIDTNGSDVAITATAIAQVGDVATHGGDVRLTSLSGDVNQVSYASIDAGLGSVVIDSAGDIVFADIRSAASGDAIQLTATGALEGVGTGPFAQASAADGRLTIDAGSLANPGPDGFAVSAGRLDAQVADAPMQLRVVGGTTVERLAHTGGGLIDLLSEGPLTFAGPVTSQSSKGETGAVVLTALGGGINGDIPAITAGDVFLHAFDGAIGNIGDKGLAIGGAKTGDWHVGAKGGVTMSLLTGGLPFAYLVSETGTVSVTATDAVAIGLLGTPLTPDFAGPAFAVVDTLDAGVALPTLPSVGTTVVEPPAYRALMVEAANDNGDGGTGTGGNTGDGGTGTGGNTGDGGTGTGGNTGDGGTGTGGNTGDGGTGTGGNTGDGGTGTGGNTGDGGTGTGGNTGDGGSGTGGNTGDGGTGTGGNTGDGGTGTGGNTGDGGTGTGGNTGDGGTGTGGDDGTGTGGTGGSGTGGSGFVNQPTTTSNSNSFVGGGTQGGFILGGGSGGQTLSNPPSRGTGVSLNYVGEDEEDDEEQ